MSTATITGRLVADAEIKYPGHSGAAVLEFRVADNHRKKAGDEWVDDGTSFWSVALWRNDAETYADLLKKGTEVVVVGEPHIREYESNGVKGKSPEIRNAVVGIRHRAPRGGQQVTPRSTPADDPWATPAQGQQYTDEPPF